MRKITTAVLAAILAAGALISCGTKVNLNDEQYAIIFEDRWSEERIEAWYESRDWPAGCNYNPANAINQLEVWQEEAFSPELIDEELALAQELGFNVVRTYLHDLAWEADPEGFLGRIERFLAICDSRGIKPLLVFFDDCWNEDPAAGKQMDPTPGVHNSGWLQSPGSKKAHDKSYWPALEGYVKGVITRFKDDERVWAWDLYNEPGNEQDGMKSFPLLVESFKWAREINPSQPLTAGVWSEPPHWEQMVQFQLDASDFISYHNYSDAKSMLKDINRFKALGRPVVCTEYMARKTGSTFEAVMPMMKEHNVGAINWGFVDGKTQTKYPWGSPEGAYEPEPWFHEIYRSDYTPYRQEEVDLIRSLTLGDGDLE